MGVLTDFVVAPRAQAREVGEIGDPAAAYKGLDAKGINEFHLASLYSILLGKPVGERFLGPESVLHTSIDDETQAEYAWVQEVPAELVRQLARLADSETIGRIAEEWARSEEFGPPARPWPLESVAYILQGLIRLARQATYTGESLLMWTCL